MARLAPPSPLARLWLVSSVARLAAALLVVVHTLPAVAVSVAAGGVVGGGWCNTMPAFLGARWRPFCGPCGWWLSCGLSVLLAWPLRAAFRWRWRRLDRLRVVLAAVAVWTAPAAAVAVAGASIKRARRRGSFAGRGGVALVAWSDCQRTGAAGVAGVAACVVAVAGVGPAAPLWRAPMVTALALAGRCGLVLGIGVVLLEGYKARGGALG